MQVTGVDLSVSLHFASLLPVQPSHSTQSVSGNDNNGPFLFLCVCVFYFLPQWFGMFVTSLNKRAYSYHANNAGLHMSRSALAWGRFEHVSEIRELQGACSHALSFYARRGLCLFFFFFNNGPTPTQLQDVHAMQACKARRESSKDRSKTNNLKLKILLYITDYDTC